MNEEMRLMVPHEVLLDRDAIERQLTKHPKAFLNLVTGLETNKDYENAFELLYRKEPEKFLKLIHEYLAEQKSLDDSGGWDQQLPSKEDLRLLNQSHNKFEAENDQLFLKEGVTVTEFVRIMTDGKGTASKENAIRNALKNKELIGYKKMPGKKASWYVPSYQADAKAQSVLQGIDRICKIFGDNGFSVHEFMVTPNGECSDKTPISILQLGDIDRVVHAAKVYCRYPVED